MKSALPDKPNSEVSQIIKRYKDRLSDPDVLRKQHSLYYNYYLIVERELKYHEILRDFIKNKDLKSLKLMEIGAGHGTNLHFFIRSGFRKESIYANELLDERFQILQENFNNCQLFQGDASTLKFEDFFDIVLQSTVFTSILDDSFRNLLAERLFDMTKPGGIVLWYDFKYNNPQNPNVRGISKNEIRSLFPKSTRIEFFKVTLAPPIGRKIGKLYPIINFFFPFLRTHLIAVIYK